MEEKGEVMKQEEIVASLLKAAGGQLAGRVRFHKTAYLLDQLGLDSGFDYDYRNYGPYSRDLEFAVLDAEESGLVKEEFGRRQIDGAQYTIFKLADNKFKPPSKVGRLTDAKLKRFLGVFSGAHITVLELAATAHWLARTERENNWEAEIHIRKGPKTGGDRLKRAIELLQEVGLPPSSTAA